MVTRLVLHGSFRSSSHSLVSDGGAIDGYTLAAGIGILARTNAMNAADPVATDSEAVDSPHHFEFVVLNLTFVRNTEQFRALTSSIIRKLSAATQYPSNGFEVVRCKASRCLLKVRIHPRRYSGILFLPIQLLSVTFCPLTLIWHTTNG